MQGTSRKEKCGYTWMRIGYADARFANTIKLFSLSAIIVLALWVYWEIPKTAWRLAAFLAIYLVAALLYLNLGVWLHEHFHCLAFWRTAHKKQTRIHFKRKYILMLSGYYRVRGAISYRIMRRALLAPINLSLCLLILGWLGSFVLPGWWFPTLLTLAVAGIIDMTHDIYMCVQIRSIGEKGKYWDRGEAIEVVWKDQAS